MKRIYEATHITHAHLLRALLEQQGITARVEGEYLQGGLGEIGVTGLIGISVAEEQAERAEETIAAFEAGQLAMDDELPQMSTTTLDDEPAAGSHPALLAIAGAVVVFLIYQLAVLLWSP